MLFSVLTDMVQLLEIKQIQIAAIREACAGDTHTYIHTYSFAKQYKTDFKKETHKHVSYRFGLYRRVAAWDTLFVGLFVELRFVLYLLVVWMNGQVDVCVCMWMHVCMHITLMCEHTEWQHAEWPICVMAQH